jgi:hypothetical protein
LIPWLRFLLKELLTLNYTKIIGLALCAASLTAPQLASAQAEQVPIPETASVSPQIEVMGTAVTTLDLGLPDQSNTLGDGSSSSGVNFSDSALAVGASEQLYKPGAIGSFVVGEEATGQTINGNLGSQLFLNEAYGDYQSRHLESYIGRTNNPTQLIQFPTLRGDDLVTFTNLQDPFSNGQNTEEARYSNVAALVLNQNLHNFVNIHVQNLIHSAADINSDQGLDSYGLDYYHETTPGMEAIHKLVSYQLGFERQQIGNGQGGPASIVYGGGVINLKPSPVNLVTLSAQDIYSTGNHLNQFSTISDTFRADSNAIAASLAYLHTPFGIPGYQVSLTAGYKDYSHVPDAGSYGLALTGVKRVGDGFDLVAQDVYQHRDAALGAVYGSGSENVVQVGFIFNFNAIFNRSVGPRRSFLNLHHQYIPER